MGSGIDVESEKKQQQNEQGQQAGVPGNNRSLLVQRLLDASANLPAFVHDLLTTQAVTVAGTEAAGFLLERGEGGATTLRPIAHIRPDASDADTRAAAISAFQEIIKPCVEKSKDGAIEVSHSEDGKESQFCLVTLLRAEGNVVAVSAVITRCVNADRARQRLMSMQLVAGYFELYTLRRNSEQNKAVAASHQHVLQLATAVATATGFESAAMNLCNELATRSGATRVSLGWLKGENVKLKALSHTEQFDKKQELVGLIEKTMEEALDQDQIVQFDPNGNSTDNVTREAQALSRSQSGHAVLSLPLRRNAEICGVICLEFLPNQQLGPQVAQGLSVAVELLAPNLYDRYQNDRWLITKMGLSAKEGGAVLIGRKHMLGKLVAVLVLATLIFTSFYKITYHVTAPFQLVSDQKVSVSAPFEGLIEKIGEINGQQVRPGMFVTKGQLLFKLKTADTIEEQLRQTTQEIAGKEGERRYHDSKGEIAQALIKGHEADALRARQSLLKYQLDHASVVAPFDGYVLKGDLTDKVGAPLKEGDALMEIGSTENLKIEMWVDERDIQDIKDGVALQDAQKQVGGLNTTSKPGPSNRYTFKIDRVVPTPIQREASNAFQVFATADKRDPDWRPGMMGEAKVDVTKKPILWVWTHRLVDYLRIKLWL